MNNFELHSLSRLFDEGDINGVNCLTKNDLANLIATSGGLDEILSVLDWCEEGVDKSNVFNTILSDIQSKYNDAIDLDQFIFLMTRLMPSNF